MSSNPPSGTAPPRSEEHTSELQSLRHLVCRLLLEKKKYINLSVPFLSLTSIHLPLSSSSNHSFGCKLEKCKKCLRTQQIKKKAKYIFFFFNDTATTEIYTLSLHDALPI